jgi:transcriptional regulator
MYVPEHFSMSEGEMQDVLRGHRVGEFITYSSTAGLLATMLPFVYRSQPGNLSALHGHLARNNEQWKHQPQDEAMVILRGPDAYVSPGWYESKQTHGRVVPTWDYITMHVYGDVIVHDEADYVRWVVTELTAKHEARQASPWSVNDAPEDFITGQLRAIVGIEIQITRIVAKAKASQNRPPADIAGVVSGLRTSGEHLMADEVERRKSR